MYPRTEYEMTEEDLKSILDACKPTPCMMIGGYMPDSPQKNANRAWSKLGKKMGFDYTTVRPIQGKGQRFFTAVPSETEAQKQERIERETKEKRIAEITRLQTEIGKLKTQLEVLVKEANNADLQS